MAEGVRIPIIKLYDVLIVSVQVALSDQVAVQLKDDVASAIERFGARGLAIDLLGIDVLDSYISRVLRDIGLIARLMGVRTVVCGLHPTIAMTLTEMGMDLQGISTDLNLERALGQLGVMVALREEEGEPDTDELEHEIVS